jgi:hypothetical protein
VLTIRTAAPAGDTHSTSRRRVPARRSSTRSWATSSPVRTSNGSSSTDSPMSLPFCASMTVSECSGKA